MVVRTQHRGPTVDECAHHWIIEGQHGPISDAQCSKCYAERTFSTPYMSTYGSPAQKFPKMLLQSWPQGKRLPPQLGRSDLSPLRPEDWGADDD